MMRPSSISQLRADAEFLQQTTLLSSAVTDVPNDAMATLQVTNKFHLEVQHLLQQRRMYPWRRKRTNHDDEIAMMQWWKSVQDFVQSHISDVLQEDGIRVLPFASKEYPPLSTLSYKGMVPIVSLTAILPMSTVCTHKNDYKHERYFEKRKEMVDQIALSLEKASSKNMTIHSLALDIRKTALLVVPAPKTFHVRIDFQMDSMDWIPSMMRLLPDRCNLLKQESCDVSKIAPLNEVHSSFSVQYNYSLTEDGIQTTIDRTVIEIYSNIQIRHGVALITLWCRQRGLYLLYQGFHDDVIKILVLYLIYSKRIPLSRNVQPISVLSSFLKLLSETQWMLPTPATDSNDQPKRSPRRTVLVMPESMGQSRSLTTSQSDIAQRYKDMVQEELAHKKKKSHHETEDPTNPLPTTLLDFYETTNAISTPVLLNSTLQHNYLFRISPSLMRRAQQYATRSLSCLYPTASSSPSYAMSHTNPFVHLFGSINDISMFNSTTEECYPTTHMNTEAWSCFFSQYDAYLRIPLSDIDASNKLQSVVTDPNSWLYHWSNDIADVGYEEALVRGLLRTLRRALHDRIFEIHAVSIFDDNGDASVGSLKPGLAMKSKTSLKYILLGLVINPDTCYRVVDRCHSAVSDVSDTSSSAWVEMQEFKLLWGPKAELRRFKDGVIVHAVVWDESSTSSSKDSIVEETSSMYVQYQNDDTWQGGIVERIVRHILKVHFLKSDVSNIPQFSIRDILSLVDGVAHSNAVLDASEKLLPMSFSPILTNPMLAHRSVMKAFESLSEWLRKNSVPTIPVPGSATAMISPLGIPLSIDRIEPISPALRYASLYPPVPHPLLSSGLSTHATSKIFQGQKRCSGAITSDPIDFQICFGPSSRWPNDLKAIGAAKTAMLIEIVNGIEKIKRRRDVDPICSHIDERYLMVTPSHAIICFMGYVFRMTIKADREIRILRNLRNPSVEASRLLNTFTKQSIVAAKHHAMVHGVYTSHPSSSATVRLAQRWLSSHLLASAGDCCLPFEIIELTVAYVYTNQSRQFAAPSTLFSGFMEWLRFISSFNWVKQPLIVDPQGHLTDADHYSITEQFERDRGELFQNGPNWFIVTPYDRCIHDTDKDVDYVDGAEAAPKPETKSVQRIWMPSFSAVSPERVVSLRTTALAKRTYSYLQQALLTPGDSKNTPKWPGAFQESRDAFQSCSVLLRIDPDFIVNVDVSSNAPITSFLVQATPIEKLEGIAFYESPFTRSMCSIANGPKDLRKKMYRNLIATDLKNNLDENGKLLMEWNPVGTMIQLLRVKLGHLALILYNDLCPEVVGVVWRRPIFLQARSFSAMTSEYARPATNGHWQTDTMVSYNVHDVVRTIRLYSRFLVSDMKVFDYGSRISTIPLPPPKIDSGVGAQVKRRRKRKAKASIDAVDSSSDESSVIDS